MTLDRRTFVTTAVALAGISLLPRSAAAALEDAPAEVVEARDVILDGRDATEEGITLDLPNIAENGAQVPITVHVESPMSAEDHVSAIHILATANPTPGIGTFHLTPRLARAQVTTRIRLAEGQRILVLAELSDGRVLQAAAEVAVSLGGCAT